MGSFWDSIKSTAKSIGGSVIAPPGAVLDLAQMPFDNKDDDFGSIVHAIAKRGGDMADPIFNPTTLTGGAVSKTLDAMNWALVNGVSEPIATFAFETQHASQKGQLGSLLDGDSWAKAYRLAQDNNAGQALTAGLLAGNGADADPFRYDDPYGRQADAHTIAAPALSWGMNTVGVFALDPTVIAGKGLGAARSLRQFHKLSEAEKADLYSIVTEGSRTGLLKGNAKSRTDKWIDWVGGDNALSRPLTGPEILHGTPELKRYAAEPHVIAGLVADANKITDVAARRNAVRRILAVAAGDTSQIARLRTEMSESGYLADTLANLTNDSVVDLRKLATVPTLRTDPQFVASLESQLDNINSAGDIDRFITNWNSRLDQLLETQHTLPNLPGVHTAGKRAILRENDTGVLRAGSKGHRALDDWAAQRALKAQSASSVFQKGLYSVPVVAVKTVGLMASPYTKAPVAVTDALRQTHFTGVANLHDWGGATAQLDSMMRIAKVSPGDRLKTLSEAYLASSEAEKTRIINQVEKLSMKSLAAHYSTRYGREVSPDYIEKLMLEHAAKRGSSLAHLRGRAYAATEMPEEMAGQMALRSQGAQTADDAAKWGGQREAKWRVDQINDDGTPLALPLLETQLANSIPLMDMGIARTLMERDHSYFARLSRAWEADSRELGRLSEMKAAGHKGLDNAIAAKAAAADWSVAAGQVAMRAWKFGVLFRLGYPIRVLMDDHMRIWSQMNAATFYGENMKELGANWYWNHLGRRHVGKETLHNLKVRRQEIIDELEGDRMVAHADRQAELKALQSSLRGHKSQHSKLRKQIAEAETRRSLGTGGDDIPTLQERLKQTEGSLSEAEGARSYLLEQLGDYGPDDLKRELASIEDMIDAGWRKLAPEKRKIGSADVTLGGDGSIPGAFGGDYGSAIRGAASSHDSFQNQLVGVEDRMFSAGAGGSHRTIQPNEAGHLNAWADVLNNQFKNSQVAMHFVNGGDVDSFVRWLAEPAQADLRKRLPHYAHDAEDWGHRVQNLVWDYIPSDEVRQALIAGRVKPRQLGKMLSDPSARPAVHGRTVADNLGSSAAALGIGKTVNRLYKYIGELPTDRLSRHPYFNSLYKSHAREIYAVKRAGYAKTGEKFTQDDFNEIAHAARKRALSDLKRTLFDVSAHSHAAHVMRFVSPFFAAHQEGIARWWRIVADNPAVVRRFAQGFDVPRYLGIEVDGDGNLVKPGAPISTDHHILLQLPKAFGGPETDPTKPGAHWTKWSISENAFNLTLQGGLSNPGLGPIAQVPLEWAAKKFADEPQVARVARIFNPYPPQSPMEAAIPATMKRLSALTYAKTGFDPSLGLGVGMREYNAAFSQNVQDAMVDFQLKYGREPSRHEASLLVDRAGTETTTQMFHRFLWNAGSPAPATPNSKYSIIQHGWYKIAQQAKAEGRDFDWAYAQFKEKYGAAYMPLVYSTSNNPAWVDANAATVGAIKHYKGILKNVDPALTRMVIGAYTDELVQKNASLGEYSPEARNFLRTQQIKPGSSDTYYSYDEPRVAADEQMARRGWQKYGELTGSLTAMAQQMGLNSYEESPALVEMKRKGVEKIRAENYAFDQDYGTFDETQYDRYIDDMRTVASSSVLKNDPERTDIQVLNAYLQLRDFFVAALDAREKAGFGGAEAQANEGIRKVYTALVGKLVESNTYFETNIYNGVVERDPLLVKD